MSEQFKDFKRRYKCANCGFIFDYYAPMMMNCTRCGSNALDEVR